MTTENNPSPQAQPTTQPNQQQVPPGMPKPGQIPAAQVQPQEPQPNPMLSHLSVPTPQHQPGVPATPAVPAPVKPAPAEPGNPTPVFQDLDTDPQVAPAIAYLEAVSTDNKLDTARAFQKAIEEGDARFLDEGYLREKLGAKADQVINTAKSVLAYADAQKQAVIQSVYEVAGGESNWRLASAAFSQHADPATKAAMQELLNSGKPDAVKYAAKQIHQFAVAQGAVSQHAVTPVGGNSSAQGLTSAQYVEKIRAKRNMSHEEYEELRSLRKLGIQQGLK